MEMLWLRKRPKRRDATAIVLDILIIISTLISALMIYSYIDDFNRLYVSTFAVGGLLLIAFLAVCIYYVLILIQSLILFPNYVRITLIFIILLSLVPLDYSALFPSRHARLLLPEDEKYLSDATKEIEFELLRFTNQERAFRNLTKLTWDPELAYIARLHSLDMVKNDFFSHINPDSKNPTDRARDAGYITHEFIIKWFQGAIVENIGIMPTGNVQNVGVVDDKPDSIAAAQVFRWMQSRNHSMNILDSDAIKMGAGVAKKGREYMITQDIY